MKYEAEITGEVETRVMRLLMETLGAALLGGLVHWLRQPRGGHTIPALLIALGTSAFIGMQSHFLMVHLGMSGPIQYAIAGACGYSAGTLLDSVGPMMVSWLCKRLGIDPTAYSEVSRIHDKKH